MSKKVLSLVVCGAMLLASIPTIAANAAVANQPDSSIVSQVSKATKYGEVVNCTSLNVRSGPSTSYDAIAWLQKGDIVTVLGKSGSWYHIQFISSGKIITGYAYETYIQYPNKLKTEN